MILASWFDSVPISEYYEQTLSEQTESEQSEQEIWQTKCTTDSSYLKYTVWITRSGWWSRRTLVDIWLIRACSLQRNGGKKGQRKLLHEVKWKKKKNLQTVLNFWGYCFAKFGQMYSTKFTWTDEYRWLLCCFCLFICFFPLVSLSTKR